MEVVSEKVEKTVTEIISHSLRIDVGKIVAQARLFVDLDAESLDLLDIRYEIENKFGIKISDNEITESVGRNLTQKEIGELLTVERVVSFVKDKLNQQ
jgi:acyl carrier protein